MIAGEGDQTVRDARMEALPRDIAVSPGDVLAGKYRVEHVLGVGGVGVVVAAVHLELDERVAIKFLLPAALKQPELVSRFAREARAAVRIKSEHVARVTDVGTLHTGAPFMVMEYLDGQDLGAIARQHAPMPIEQSVEYLLQACEAVAEAHTLGIVHRDLKPSNLFVTRRADGSPVVKVLDFGISKVKPRAGSRPEEAVVTQTSSVIGSPLYMSPEQMESTRDVDARTDLWSLGTILYELISGACPFDAPTMPQLVAKILRSPPAPLRGYRPDAPPELEAVLIKCLEKDPERRYRNVAELALALAPFAPKRALLSVQRVVRVIQVAGLGFGEEAPPSSAGYEGPAQAERTQALAATSLGDTGRSLHKSPRGVLFGALLGGAALAAAVAWMVGVPGRQPALVANSGVSPASAVAIEAARAVLRPSPGAEPVATPKVVIDASDLPSAPTATAAPQSRPRPGRPKPPGAEPDVLDER
jgi:eukaryotic-like serine/threonine-protein kinase